jgi:hypothetical protein
MADQGSPDAMGRQARDHPPKGVINRPHCGIAQAAAIAHSWHPAKLVIRASFVGGYNNSISLKLPEIRI